MSNFKLLFTSTIAIALTSVMPLRATAELVDTDGNAATNTTYLGDIDMGKGTLGDLTGYMSGSFADRFLPLNGGGFVNGEVWAYERDGDIALAALAGMNTNIAMGVGTDGVFPMSRDVDGLWSVPSTIALRFDRDTLRWNVGDDQLVIGTDMPIYFSDVSFTNSVNNVATNGVIVGYSDWSYSGDVQPSVQYSITSSGQTWYLWDSDTGVQVGTTTSQEGNPLELAFSVGGGSGTIYAVRYPKRRLTNGLAPYSDIQILDQKIDVVDGKIEAVSNDVVTVSNRLETIDTSYWHYSITNDTDSVTISNRNQSVTTLISTAPMVSTLHIKIPPEEAMTKDWLVYVFPVTNVVLSLEAATYYVSDETVTNDITSATALYFSQVNPGVYTLGRKEFMAITIPDSAEAAILGALQRNSRRMPSSYRRAATPYIKVNAK